MRMWALGGVAAAVVICPLVAPGAAPAQPQDEKVTLRYTWEEGRTLTYRMTQELESASTMPGGGEQKMKQTQVMRTRMHTRSVDDAGKATVESTIDAVRFGMEGPVSIQYDSEDPASKAEHPAAKMMAALVGTAFTFTITPTGDVEDVSGMDEAIDRIAAASGAAAMGGNLKKQLGDEAIEGMFEQSMRMLPERPIGVGEAWKTNFEMPLPIGTVRTDSTMTLEGIEETGGKRLARIKVESQTTLGEGGPEGLPPGMSMKMDDAAGQGVLMFDIGGGFVRSMEIAQAMPITMIAKGMGEGGADLEVKQSVKSTTKMELVEDGDDDAKGGAEGGAAPKTEKPAK